MLSKLLLPNCTLPFVKAMQSQNRFNDGYLDNDELFRGILEHLDGLTTKVENLTTKMMAVTTCMAELQQRSKKMEHELLYKVDISS